MNQRKKWITQVTAARIRKLRKQKDLSQEELALRAGINTVYYGQLERGQKCPTIDTLYKIATGLQISIPELLSFDVSSTNAGNTGTYKSINEHIEQLLRKIPPDKMSAVVKLLEDISDLL